MSESVEQYRRDGFFLWPGGAIDDTLLARAQAALLAVRDECYDTGVPPSSHPGYDPQKLCKINDAHLASKGLYDLLVDSELGSHLAAVTGSQRIQVWASVLRREGWSSAVHGGSYLPRSPYYLLPTPSSWLPMPCCLPPSACCL